MCIRDRPTVDTYADSPASSIALVTSAVLPAGTSATILPNPGANNTSSLTDASIVTPSLLPNAILLTAAASPFPVSYTHLEGRFVAPKEWVDKLFANGQVATQYVNEDGQPTMDEEWNVNGSYASIEGITSPDGRILGKMAHAERRGESVAINIYGEQDMKLFESGVNYFK